MKPIRSFAAAIVFSALAATASDAQTVLVRVMDEETSLPTFGALAYLIDEAGRSVKNALTDERGRALFVGIADGSYRVRAEMIGMATGETDLFAIGPGVTVTRDLRLASRAIQLEGLEVELESGRCSVRPEGLLVAEIWDEARKALAAASLTDESGVYRYETMRYERRIERDTGTILREDQERNQGYMLTPFEARPAEDLAENGFVQHDGRGFMYYAPDAAVLLSDPFLDTHCLRIDDAGEGGPELIGLGFEPTGDNKTVPDIEGTMWLDRETAELRWLEFRYVYLDPDMMSSEVGGRVDFERMPNGTWIVPEWWIRMPVMARQSDFRGQQRTFISGYHQTGGRVLEARVAGGRQLTQRDRTGGIEGVVMDSIGAPLPGVRVSTLGSNQEVFTDDDGEFSITGLSVGRHRIRFVDPALEALGRDPELVTRDVIEGELSFVEYYMPAMGDLLFEACRGAEQEFGPMALIGSVVDERGRGVGQATVRVSWNYFSAPGNTLRVDQMDQARQGRQWLELQASSGGGFSFCGLPAETRMGVQAVLGERESEMHELRIEDWDIGAVVVIELGR